MPKIFISYRREDSEAITGRISDRLVQAYGPDSVLLDVDSMIPGRSFRDRIAQLLRECDVMAAIVGPKWAGPLSDGHLRIEKANDWVRVEIETALAREIPLIPVLVLGAAMPDIDTLPETMKNFAFMHALHVGGGPDFHPHVDRLIRSMNRLLDIDPASSPSPAAQTPILVPPAAIVAKPALAASAPQGLSFQTYRDRHLFGPGPKFILALKGTGGVRAAITLAFLERIEKVIAEQQQGRTSRLADCFDLIGGPSTGGLLSTALALGYGTERLKQFFVRFAAQAFKRRSAWSMLSMQAKFDHRILRGQVEELIGNRSLGSHDLLTGLCILMKRIDTGALWVIANNPRYHYWNTPDDNSFIGNRHFPLANLVRASTAAPGYFAPEELPIVPGAPSGLFVDGGMSLHANPALVMFLMSTLKSHGIQWSTGSKALTIALIGDGSFRRRMNRQGMYFAAAFRLALQSLMSLAGEADDFVLAQMRLLGESPMRPPVVFLNGEMDGRPLGGPYFTFLHYDVRLEAPWLEESLGLKVSERDVARFRSVDDPTVISDLYDIARTAAEKQVKPEHWANITSIASE